MTTGSPATAAAVLLAVRSLRDLAAWDEVAALAERAVDSVRGVGGLDRHDAGRLRSWPARWAAVRPEIRRFFVEALAAPLGEEDRAAVALGLRAHLDLRPAEGWVRGRLARLHVHLTGEDAGFPLCPG